MAGFHPRRIRIATEITRVRISGRFASRLSVKWHKNPAVDQFGTSDAQVMLYIYIQHSTYYIPRWLVALSTKCVLTKTRNRQKQVFRCTVSVSFHKIMVKIISIHLFIRINKWACQTVPTSPYHIFFIVPIVFDSCKKFHQ